MHNDPDHVGHNLDYWLQFNRYQKDRHPFVAAKNRQIDAS